MHTGTQYSLGKIWQMIFLKIFQVINRALIALQRINDRTYGVALCWLKKFKRQRLFKATLCLGLRQ